MGTTLAEKVKYDRSFWIKIAVTFGIPVIIWLLPTNEIFTREMRMAIALTFWFLAWAAFELSDLSVPSLLWPILLIIAGVCSAQVVYSPYLSSSVPGCIGCLLLANILDRIGLLRRIAFWIARKSGGTFNKAVYGVFLAGFVVSILTFASGCVIVAALCYGMCKSLGLVKQKEGAVIMMTGMLAASTTRMFLYYPITMGAMLSSVQSVDPTFSFGFIELLKYNWPVLIYCLIFVGLMLKFATRKDGTLPSGKEFFDAEYQKLGPVTRDEKNGALIVLFVLVWILTNPLHHLDAMYAFVIGSVIFYLPGVGVGKQEDVRNVPLGTILFFASCMAIGSVCVAVGITAYVGGVFTPLFADVGTVGALFLVLLFGIAANFAMTPMAMLAGFTGMFYTISLNMGLNPLAAIFVFNHSTDMVFFPYEYLTFLIFYAFGCMTSGQFLKFHAIKNLLYIVFFAVVMIPYWFLVGLI